MISSKARRKARGEGNRPSTFFLVAIVVALVFLVVAFVSYVVTTPGARPKAKQTSVAAFARVV